MLLTVIRGDTTEYTLRILEDDIALDLTGYLIRFTVKNDPDDLDSQAITRLSSGTSGVALSPQSGDTVGMFTVTLLRSDTVGLLKNLRAYWDIQLTAPDGSTVTPLYGDIFFAGEVTHNDADIGSDI